MVTGSQETFWVRSLTFEHNAAAVPAELIDEISHVGTENRIREQAEPWLAARDAGHIATMILRVTDPAAMALAADIFLS